jgi:ABC-type polysaccharide/polyol phosphate export permease
VNTVTEIWTYRNLVYNLAQRELRARYKKSILGWLWSLINPAATLLIYSLVFGFFLKVEPPVAGNGELKVFALYLFCGLVIWNFFSGTVNGAIMALESSGGLLNKVYFPPAIPAIANMVTVLLQAVIEGFILVAVMLVVGNASLTFLLFPVLLVFVGMFSLGLGLFLSVFNVYYRDVGYLVGIGMQILFYLTPIVYTMQLVEAAGGARLVRLFSLNPMTQYVQWSRDAFYLLRWPGWPSWLGVIAVSVLTLVVGWAVFVRKARNIAEEL